MILSGLNLTFEAGEILGPHPQLSYVASPRHQLD